MSSSWSPRDLTAGWELRRLARGERQPSLTFRHVVDVVPELAAMRLVPQDPRWHPEGDVLTHSLAAADHAGRLCDMFEIPTERREIVVLAALFHDVGKPETTRADFGKVTSFGHAERGETIVRQMARRFVWPEQLIAPIAGLVRHHMAHISVSGEPSLRAVRRLNSRLLAAATSMNEWAMVVEADGSSRGAASTPNQADAWIRVASQSRLEPM